MTIGALPVSLGDVATELGVSSISLGDANVRGLAGVAATGDISLSSLANTSRVTQIGQHTDGQTVQLGVASTSRRIFAVLFHGNVSTDPGLSPVCQIGGQSLTLAAVDSNGDGVSDANGVAIFAGNITGTSGVLNISWGAAAAIACVVFRVIDYTQTKTDSDTFLNTDVNPLTVSVPSSGLLIAAALDATGFSSGVTLKFSGTVVSSKTGYIGWDINLPTNAARNINVSGVIAGQGGTAAAAATFAAL